MPVLVCFSGLPAVGKSTLAKRVASALGGVYLRVDSVEQSLRDYEFTDDQIGGAGYGVVCRVATDNLLLGRHVVADQVNPWPLTRDMFRKAASQGGSQCLDLEIVCSDPAEHRRRVESRKPEVTGLKMPGWDEVVERDYQPWTSPILQIDTAKTSAPDAVAAILRAVARC